MERAFETKVSEGNENKMIKIKGDGTPAGTTVLLSDGTRLGYVQRIVYDCTVGELAKLTIETVLSQVELDMLQKDIDITVKVVDKRLVMEALDMAQAALATKERAVSDLTTAIAEYKLACKQ